MGILQVISVLLLAGCVYGRDLCKGRCGSDEFCSPPYEFCDPHVYCVAKCRGNVCGIPNTKGPCKDGIGRYYYDSYSGTCREGACDSNTDNNFDNVKDCRKVCRAKDPCKAYCRDDQQCELLFPTCFRSPCLDVTCTDICDLPKVEGTCDESLRRWFYNSETRKCEKFIYGGCGGNKNNFNKKRKCLKAASHCRNQKPCE